MGKQFFFGQLWEKIESEIFNIKTQILFSQRLKKFNKYIPTLRISFQFFIIYYIFQVYKIMFYIVINLFIYYKGNQIKIHYYKHQNTSNISSKNT